MSFKTLYNEEFDLMELNGVEVVFTPLRLKRDFIPNHLFVYDIRSSDDGATDFATIEKKVLVNHTGTIISKTPLMCGEDFVEIEDYNFLDETTLADYLHVPMEIEKVDIDNVTYRLFHIEIYGTIHCIAEEKLEKYIQKYLENNQYGGIVERIDNRYGYYVSQDIADTEDESKIKQSVIEIMNNEFPDN